MLKKSAEKTLMRKIIFLGYDRSKTSLIGQLESCGCDVKSLNEAIGLDEVNDIDLIVCFGYRYVLEPEFIAKCSCPILNLHISYLPFNRGAHPNFWSFYDGTQSGVTIHLVDDGIDTGPILFQKKVNFVQEKTFSDTHARLLVEVEALFSENLQLILNKKWAPRPQRGPGTSHKIHDLPNGFSGWNSIINDEIFRLKNIGAKPTQ